MKFDAILSEARERRRARERTPLLSVATGECGFAVGAEQVVEAVRSELERRGIVAHVAEVGCNGMCHEAVMIDVERPGLPRITYGRMTEDRVPWLIEQCLANGQSRPDWEVVCDVARRVCAKLGIAGDQFGYTHPEQIFREMASLMPQLAGMTFERLEQGGLQWPCPTSDHPGTPLLFSESFPRGRGRFVVVEQGPRASELPDKEYPLLLNTGRMLYHWHGGTMSQKVDGLLAMMPEPAVSVNFGDAAELGIRDGDWVKVQSRRDEIMARAMVTDAVGRGEVFMPFAAFGHSAANFLTNAVYDPDSHIPEYKVCAVRVEKA